MDVNVSQCSHRANYILVKWYDLVRKALSVIYLHLIIKWQKIHVTHSDVIGQWRGLLINYKRGLIQNTWITCNEISFSFTNKHIIIYRLYVAVYSGHQKTILIIKPNVKCIHFIVLHRKYYLQMLSELSKDLTCNSFEPTAVFLCNANVIDRFVYSECPNSFLGQWIYVCVDVYKILIVI